MGLTGFNLARREEEEAASAASVPSEPAVCEAPVPQAETPKRGRKKKEVVVEASAANNDCGRRGEAQSAGTGDHQDRHGIDQCRFEFAAPAPPIGDRQRRQCQYGRHEHAGDAIGEPLHRCF